MTQPYPSGVPAPGPTTTPKKRRSGGVTAMLFVLGTALIVLPLIAFFAAIAMFVPSVLDQIDELEVVDPTAEVTLEAGDDLALFARTDDRPAPARSDCTVSSAAGEEQVSGLIGRTRLTLDDATYERFGVVPSPGAGTYTVQCSHPEARILAGPDLRIGEFFNPAVFISIAIGIVAMLIGLVLVTWAIVRVIFSLSERRDPIPQPYPVAQQHQVPRPPPPTDPRPPTHR